MNKLFRPKCMRRMAVFMALVAPIVYLFGSLFFALNGAHGTEVFAEPVYVNQWVDVDSLSDGDGDYRLSVNGVKNILSSSSFEIKSFAFDFNFNSNDETSVSFFTYSNSRRFGVRGAAYLDIGVYYVDSSTYSENPSSPWIFYFSPNGDVSSFIEYLDAFDVGYSLSLLMSVPTSEVPENAGAYSDYVFKNFFAKDNFLVQWGENAISENPYGFAPFGYFWRYLDLNVLHMSNEQVGLMAYGYMYYAAHVLLFDVGFILVTFFLTFIQKVADKIGGEDHA